MLHLKSNKTACKLDIATLKNNVATSVDALKTESNKNAWENLQNSQ